VVKADYHPGYGHFIIIDHGREQESLYAHLKGKEVRRGERVRQGEEIGILGKTGNAHRRAILPNLHFEWIDHGNPQDPTELVRQAKVKTENGEWRMEK
jgi:murein DD-endopeptidase MepM/ murein hydrolase activator NlpD